MQTRIGTITDAQQVADFWNAQTLNKDSAWFGAPTVTALDIEQRLADGCSLAVAIEANVCLGLGIWHGQQALGFTALDSNTFLALLKLWAAAYPGSRGTGIVTAKVCNERTWMDALPFTLTPLGHKPMKPGDKTRKVWTYRAECELDDVYNF